jgi:NADPH-dependent curcumin reductase CurA
VWLVGREMSPCTEVLGFDVCLDHHAQDFAQQLAKACPQGIDIYYENVGGKVFDAVLPLLNTSARIPLVAWSVVITRRHFRRT